MNISRPWNWFTLRSDSSSLPGSKVTLPAWTPQDQYQVWHSVSVYQRPTSAHSQTDGWQKNECGALVEWCWQRETYRSATSPTTNPWD